jgi:t-SNARE complex subunit (syntaxin)
VLAVFTAPGLTAADLADLYLESAQTANRTKITDASQPLVEGRSGRRLDTKTGERTQTVLVWPSATTDAVNVVITNDLPDARIDDAVAAFEGR